MAAGAQAPLYELYGQNRIQTVDDLSVLSQFHEGPDSFNRKTKIICTMGPSCWDVETLVQLIDAGMNICRLNFSHGDHEVHGATVQRIREAAKQRPDKPIAILLDTKGPEIRTGFFREDVGKSINLKAGQDLKLVTDYEFKGDSTTLALSYSKLPQSVEVGGQILCADGTLVLKVKSIGEDHVMTEVMNNCSIGERKNCNLPGVKVELPVLQEKDVKDLTQFGIPQGVDFVAASFVQSADDVKLIKKTLGLRGRSIKIISKIENEAGLKNFDEIVEASDGIMVARGDLGMEIPTEKVFLAQKVMIAKCNAKGKPVITATQMLESMVGLPRPTRAEAGDVANAVLDGSDCVMLSGETAAGKFPLNAVTIMRRICEEAESVIDYGSAYLSMRLKVRQQGVAMQSVESICSSAVKASIDAGCPLIITLTETGATARQIAKYNPKAVILSISASETTVRQLLLVKGVVPMLTASFVGTEAVIQKALAKAKADGMVKVGDSVVAVHGQREECAGHSNLMKMVTVS
jgi:pyruvate kinase